MESDEQTLPVSVVITVYNRAQLVERSLSSVAAQRPSRPAEVIVVDDGSTDDSAAVAEAAGARVIRHGRNLGTGAAKQTGLRAARHDWVALLDSDDEWLPGHLAAVWAMTPGRVLVAASCLECDPDSPERSFHGALDAETQLLASPADVLHPENPVPDSAAMVHRDTALAVGGFRGGVCEDLDIWCRVLERGQGAVSPTVGALYHRHPGQISGDWEAMHEQHLAVARSHPGAGWWRRGVVERRLGVTSWDRFRAGRREGSRGASIEFVRDLARHPQRSLGVLGVIRHRIAMRRRASRTALDGGPSVAVLPGADPASIPSEERYEVDLSASGSVEALVRLLRRPSAAALVSSRRQAALVRLAGIRPRRGSAS